ncbi:hypothetical protein FQA47_023241 [Oryzias melastigma]|uniref:Uncharacterized protein n=1 Tax=Oryzias melastigma TaxID=30732 RepID=A0A834FBA4_ORYME|nr:hypothetical protein FQA47_023241 [Oryzias melastigma]
METVSVATTSGCTADAPIITSALSWTEPAAAFLLDLLGGEEEEEVEEEEEGGVEVTTPPCIDDACHRETLGQPSADNPYTEQQMVRLSRRCDPAAGKKMLPPSE